MFRVAPPPPPLPARLRREAGLRLRRWVRRRRRLLASGLAALAAGVLAQSLLALAAPDTVPAVVVARPVPAGGVTGPGDVVLRPVPRDLLPEGALLDAATVPGATAVVDLAVGEVVTAARFGTPPGAGDPVPGRATVVAGLADPWASTLAVPGSHVDVYAPAASWLDGTTPGPPGRPLARDAVVVRVLGDPAVTGAAVGAGPEDLTASPGGAALAAVGSSPGWGGGTPAGVALVLAVEPADAPGLAALAGQGVTITGSGP